MSSPAQILQVALKSEMVICACFKAPFGPNPECSTCGGGGRYVPDPIEESVNCETLTCECMRAKGYIGDSTQNGLARWSHPKTNRAIIRQPYMSNAQWAMAKQLFVTQFPIPSGFAK